MDAVLVSLRANADHGKRREAGDYRKAYDIACRYELVPPADADAVAKLLRCSIRWAEILTKNARALERMERDAAIQHAKAEGKSVREISDELGLPRSTVHDGVRKTHTAETGQGDPLTDARVSQSPTGQRWHRALEALRLVNAQAEVSAMFADRYTGVDHTIGPELWWRLA